MKRNPLAPLLLLTLCLFASTPAVHAYDTDHVVLVVIDGLRDTEAFAYEFQPGETEHPYLPFIWNTLKPLGTAYMEMYNIGVTHTSAGHGTLLTGDWQVYPNHHYPTLDETYQTRPWTPTIFEYARKAFPQMSEDTTWCVVGKENCLEINWSLHPEYGEDYGASLIRRPVARTPDTDSLTVSAAINVIDTYHPTLLFVNLRGVDEAGHYGNWDHYTEAIRLADVAVKRLWDRIRTGINYRNRTTFIVTTDHGRHDIEAPNGRGFWGHGGICHGCRHIMCLVVGPDTPDSLEVTRRVYQIDIAPTIGELHGFPTPYARGQVLWESVNGYGGERIRPIMKEPSVDVDDSLVAVAWSDNRSGNDEVSCMISYDRGQSFGDTVHLSNSGVMAVQPSIAVGGEKVHAVWLDYRNDRWEIFYRRSTNAGMDWEPEIRLMSGVEETWNDSTQRETGSVWPWDPAVDFEGDVGMITFVAERDSVAMLRSSDGGAAWDTLTISDGTFYPSNLGACFIGPDEGSIWCDQKQRQDFNNWDVYFKFPGYEKKRLSTNPSYSIQPSIDSDEIDNIGVAWADNRSADFQITFRKSADGGASWQPAETVTTSGVGAWRPGLAWIPATNGAHLIWTDYREGWGEIYYSRRDGRGWSAEERLTTTLEGSVNRPSLGSDAGGNTFMAWEVVTDDSVYLGVGDLVP